MGHKVTHVNFLNRFLMQEKPEKGHMHFPTRLQLQATPHGVPLVMGGRGRGRGGGGEREWRGTREVSYAIYKGAGVGNLWCRGVK